MNDTLHNTNYNLIESFEVLCEYSAPHFRRLSSEGMPEDPVHRHRTNTNPYAERMEIPIPWLAHDFHDSRRRFAYWDMETNSIMWRGEPLLCNDREMGGYSRTVSGQRLGKRVPITRQQIRSNVKVVYNMIPAEMLIHKRRTQKVSSCWGGF
jgi:hypothetical protein